MICIKQDGLFYSFFFLSLYSALYILTDFEKNCNNNCCCFVCAETLHNHSSGSTQVVECQRSVCQFKVLSKCCLNCVYPRGMCQNIDASNKMTETLTVLVDVRLCKGQTFSNATFPLDNFKRQPLVKQL